MSRTVGCVCRRCSRLQQPPNSHKYRRLPLHCCCCRYRAFSMRRLSCAASYVVNHTELLFGLRSELYYTTPIGALEATNEYLPDVAIPATHLIVSSCSQHLTRPRANSHAVGLDSVCHKLMRLETRERAKGARTRLKHDQSACTVVYFVLMNERWYRCLTTRLISSSHVVRVVSGTAFVDPMLRSKKQDQDCPAPTTNGKQELVPASDSLAQNTPAATKNKDDTTFRPPSFYSVRRTAAHGEIRAAEKKRKKRYEVEIFARGSASAKNMNHLAPNQASCCAPVAPQPGTRRLCKHRSHAACTSRHQRSAHATRDAAVQASIRRPSGAAILFHALCSAVFGSRRG